MVPAARHLPVILGSLSNVVGHPGSREFFSGNASGFRLLSVGFGLQGFRVWGADFGAQIFGVYGLELRAEEAQALGCWIKL